MIKVLINGQSFQLPEKWEDVPMARLPELLRNVFVLPESGATYHEILRIVLGYSGREWKRLMRQFFGPDKSELQKANSTQALADLLKCIDWLWKGELLIQPFSSFTVNDQSWLLFEEGFQSMSFGELTDAYIHAQAFTKQLIEGEERLDMLVATICRPERDGDYRNDPEWNGDSRQNYNEHIAMERAKLIKNSHQEEKILVMVYFLSTIKNFFSYYDLFDNDGSAPPVPEEFPGQSMIKNQHLLSEKHIFGGMKLTKAANVYDVFQFLEEHHKDEKEEIARQKSNQF